MERRRKIEIRGEIIIDSEVEGEREVAAKSAMVAAKSAMVAAKSAMVAAKSKKTTAKSTKKSTMATAKSETVKAKSTMATTKSEKVRPTLHPDFWRPKFFGKGAESFPDRTVEWKGVKVLVRQTDEVLFTQDKSTKTFACYMGRCVGAEAFSDSDDFSDHVTDSHVKSGGKDGLHFQFWRYKAENPLVCDRCNLRFNDPVKMDDHLCDSDILRNANLAGRSVGTGEGTKTFYECEICGLRSTTKCGKENHVRTHFYKRVAFGESTDVLKCKTCGFVGETESQLWIHQSTHRKQAGTKNLYPCTLCDFRAKSQPGLHQHLQKRHKREEWSYEYPTPPAKRQKTVKISVAEKIRATSRLTKSVEIIGEFKNVIKSEDERKNLPVEKKEIPRLDLIDNEPAKKYSCEICGYLGTDETALQKHKCQPKKTQSHPECLECGKTFFSSWSLQHHSCNSTACRLCGESCTSGAALTAHAETHPMCPTCGIRLTNEVELAAHVATHPKCQTCGKRFVYALDLTRHSRLHPSCSHCGKLFNNRASLAKHDCCKASPDKEKKLKNSFSCEKCEEEFSSKLMLMMHQAEKHFKS